GQEHAKSTLVDEFPKAEGDPYYPVLNPEAGDIYKRYKALADATPDVHFVGRLATYKYYNMDQVVAQSLAEFERIVGRKLPVTKNGHAPLPVPAATALLDLTTR